MPLKSGGLKLDGRVLWDTFFDRPAAEATIAILGCNTSMQSDLRPRDWPPDWVTHLRRLHADPLALALFSYSAEDRLTTSPNDPDARKDLELASASFSHLTEKLKHEPKASAAFEFHRCWIRSRYFGEKVSPNFERAKSDEETSPFEILRLQAALTALDGDSPAAVELLAQAETSLAANVKHGIDATDLDALRAFREELLTNPAIAPHAVGVAEGDHGDARG